jgi:molecular chaperone GrpE
MNDDTPLRTTESAAEGTAQADGGATQAEAGADAVASRFDAQLAEQRDKLLRLAAEYDNFRKRSVRERQEAELKGMGFLIRGILDVLDDLGRFAHVDPAATDAATLRQGVEMVEKKLLKSLSGHGLEIVNPVGEPFDPAVHEAIVTANADRPEDDHLISQVFQVGYLFNGQLLRAARVSVRQWKGSSGDDSPAGPREHAGLGD